MVVRLAAVDGGWPRLGSRPMGSSSWYDDAELTYAFGAATLERGRDYQLRGHVLEVDVNATNPRITLVHGRVLGSSSRVYATTVTVAEDPSGLWVESRCTCPMVRMCKHAAALLLAAEE